jgi:hypothetical protein
MIHSMNTAGDAHGAVPNSSGLTARAGSNLYQPTTYGRSFSENNGLP